MKGDEDREKLRNIRKTQEEKDWVCTKDVQNLDTCPHSRPTFLYIL